MALKYKHEVREDLRHAVEMFVILATVLLMFGSFWFGPACAEWLLGHLEEPVDHYHVSKSGIPSPWPVRVHMVAAILPMLLIGLLGFYGLRLLDMARSKQSLDR